MQKEHQTKSWAEVLHLWSLGLVLAVEELRQSPPFNGVNAAREIAVDSEGIKGGREALLRGMGSVSSPKP